MDGNDMSYLKQIFEIIGSTAAGLALVIALVPTAMSQETSTQEGAAEAVDEVVIVGEKSLQNLQRDMDKAQANFFDVYNSYNNDAEYEVKCEYKSSLGSRRKEHDCKAKFQREYEEELARGTNSLLGGGQQNAPPSSKGMRKRQEKFQKKISDAISRHEEMREALTEFGNAKKALEAERQKR
jgi:hypothetical protein